MSIEPVPMPCMVSQPEPSLLGIHAIVGKRWDGVIGKQGIHWPWVLVLYFFWSPQGSITCHPGILCVFVLAYIYVHVSLHCMHLYNACMQLCILESPERLLTCIHHTCTNISMMCEVQSTAGTYLYIRVYIYMIIHSNTLTCM